MASMSLQSAYDQARQWLESNDLDRAIGLSQHILEHYPDNLEAYRILGEAYLANRQLDRAQESFERVLRSDPENIPAHVGLGITYERQGKLERAMPEFEQALEIKPDMAELRSQLLRLYADAWGSENAQLRLSRAGLARLYAKGHMLPQAITEFRQVIADQPGRFDAMVALAEALWRDGQEDDAITLCHDILAKRPESLKANLILGYLEMASGQPEGERFWEAARRMDPYQVVAKALFDTLPPDTAGEPMIEEWDEAAWQRRRTEEQQEQMPATRPMAAVTPTAVPAFSQSVPWREQRPAQPAASAANAADTDDFLAGLLALTTPAEPSQPAPAPTPAAPSGGFADDEDLDLIGFSLDDIETQPHAQETPSAPAQPTQPTQPAPHEDEPIMTPFSLADLGLTEDEIAGLDSLDAVSTEPEQERRPSPTASHEDADMQPFSLADLGLTEDEIAGLDSLRMDTTEPAQPSSSGKTLFPAAEEEPFEAEDLPLDLQPFSLDELDLGTGADADKTVGGLPSALQPFSLDEVPPRPRVSGFAAEESFENISDEEDIIPETGGYSWQQPSQRPETGFLKRGGPETSGDDVSIFAKLKQRRQQEPEPEVPSSEALPPDTHEGDAHLGLFSLDDVSLRDDAEVVPPAASAGPAPSAPEQQTPLDQPARQETAAEPAAPPEVENLEDAIAAGQVQPFSLADLGLSAEEIAALGLGDATPAPETAETAPPREAEEVQPSAPEQPHAQGSTEVSEITLPTSGTTRSETTAESQNPGEEPALMPSDLKPFSLTDLGLSDDEIAALGLGSSADVEEEEPSSELGITEEELAGLDLVDPNWGAAPTLAEATPPAEPEEVEMHNLSGDLVVDRLIALGHQQGYVDISDIISGVEDPEAEAERIEEIGRLLHEAKVEIRDGDEVIDMDAEYAEEESLAAAPESESPEAGESLDEDPSMTPFSLSELGLTEEEIAALGLGETAPAPAETPAASAPAAEVPPVEAPQVEQPEEEPSMTPFSLSELGLTEEEIAALGLGEAAPAPAETPAASAPAAEVPPVEQPEEEPSMAPFSLSELGLSEEEIASLESISPAPEAAAEEPASQVEETLREEPQVVPASQIEEPPREEPPIVPAPESARPPVAEEIRRAPAAAPPATPTAPRGTSPAPPAASPTVPAGNEVLDSFVSRLEAEPQNHALRLSVARVAGQIGMTDFAMQQYRQLIKRATLLDDVKDDLADLISDADDQQVLQRLHRLLGDVYSKQGRFREAIDEYSWTLSGPQHTH